MAMSDMGPKTKTLQRILGLQQIVAQFGRGHNSVELAGAAATAGYADQSHLTRESRLLTGLPPRQLARWIG